jgi:hypothetical protein
MSYGPYAVFTASVASGATASSAVDLGRSWFANYLVVPSMTSNSQLHLKASETLDGTYRRVKHPPVNSATVAVNEFTILSANTGCIVPMPSGLRYVQVETTATVDGGCSFTILCGGG